MSAITGYYAPAGQGWRLAYSLVTLAHELAAVYGDQLTCLGTVGDVAHAAEAMGSDHNPFVRDPGESSVGIVRAIDFGGPDSVLKQVRQQIWNLYAARDPRMYGFGYAKGCSDNLINNWGLPFGTHVDTGDAGHLHVSVTQVNGRSPSPGGYVAAIDSTASWGFASLAPDGGGTQIGGLSVTDIDTILAAINGIGTQIGNQVGSFRNEDITHFDVTVVPLLQEIQKTVNDIDSRAATAVGGGPAVDLGPVLAAIQALPAATVAALKEAL